MSVWEPSVRAIRLECLRLAHGAEPNPKPRLAEEVVKRAPVYAAFELAARDPDGEAAGAT
jgi:hypothetical protein